MTTTKTAGEATITPRRLGTLLRYNLVLVHTHFFGGAMRFSEYRRQYTLGGLRRSDLWSDPVDLFTQWQTQAINAGLADPTACVPMKLKDIPVWGTVQGGRIFPAAEL